MTTEEEWWIGSYAEDIHHHLRSKERSRFIFLGQSPQLHLRKSMIEWMDMVCQKMEFCTTVQHLAVYLLDIFMDNHTIYNDHLRMVIIGCLIVAVKLEERDHLIPKNSYFNILLENKYKLIEFVHVEISILSFFKWDILHPTAAHFAEYYALYALQQSDSLGDKPLPNYELIKIYIRKYIDYFLEVSILDPIFNNFTPSLVAASCIASTRICLSITPSWSEQLLNVTCYKYLQLKPCIEKLMKALDMDLSSACNSPECYPSHASQCSDTGGNSSPVSTDCIAIT
ncbi:cyclin-J [Trichonephila inaurata madagascariensis]|uniref:Cyclin-J n=1 Tax=Trichonephila inaurata madagascariensis TaxID=2747483 RepID=A0A8X7C2F4_9ARAC|nr:cyclin-J [Trichonephila inaurata madagascariensis]